MHVRVNVSLPDDLHAAMVAADLSPSELLQRAIRCRIDDTNRLAVLDELLAGMEPLPPGEDQWTIWADETLREHIDRRAP